MSIAGFDSFTSFCLVWLGLAVIVHVALFFVTAPFGRHSSGAWGPGIPNRLGWVLMEFPSLALMVFYLYSGSHSREPGVVLLFALWIAHYVNRTFIYPLRIHASPKKMPLAIVVSGGLFNTVNGGINGWYLAEGSLAGSYGASWAGSPGFWIGITLFVAGMALNQVSDTRLINLRKQGSTGYVIPRGGLFEFVAAPNLLGEVVEWAGFAILAWNLPALCFFAWTWANLVPRARNHLDWYRKTFPDYPSKRKALFPFIW